MNQHGGLCSVVSDARDWDQVMSIDRHQVDVDWWGRSLQRPFRYALGRDDCNLVFVSEVPQAAPAPAGLTHGAFVANLAEPETRGATAELFVMLQDGRYFEVHISPEGAWWYMDFSGYRKRVPGRIPSGVEIRIDLLADSWVGAIRLPFEQLPVAPGSVVRYQATVALCTGPSPVYITSAGAPTLEPDFHDERVFSEIKL
jgi:hypothetical protein